MSQNTPARSNKHTQQNILNWSFDDDYKVLVVEMLGYDTSSQVLRRITVNNLGQLKTA